MTLEQTLQWLGTQQKPMEAQLEELVSINSFTQNVRGVERCQELLRTTLAALPLNVQLHPSEKYGPHLSFSTAAIGRARGPLLIGHMDTVFPPETFEGYRSDGERAYGPGVLDMKGGLVVVTFALRALAEAGRLESTPLQGVVVSEEEIGSPESQALIRAMCPSADRALGFESGRANDLIITRRKGTGAFVAEAFGKAAHAGNLHHEGVNAIWALARFVDRAQQLTDYARGVTVNVGSFNGGQSKNTVPDHAKAGVDFRFCSVEDGKAMEAALRAAADEAVKAVKGATLKLEGGMGRTPLERTEASAELYRAYAACQKACGLGDGEAPLLGGGSDAATTSAAGVPSIDGLGPRGLGFHTREEQIELGSLIPKAAALVRYLWPLAAP
ncbi:MAG: M20 family metallopeptidase [Myxococcales bacterium]